ncbi:MAG: hypothetical protein ACLGJC_03385, partial [Alphaproteobacteria bacterium]
ASIQAAGVPEAAFLARVDAIAEAAFDDQCTGANPRYPLVAEIKQLLIDSYYGRAYAEPSAQDAAPVQAPAKAAARKDSGARKEAALAK